MRYKVILAAPVALAAHIPAQYAVQLQPVPGNGSGLWLSTEANKIVQASIART